MLYSLQTYLPKTIFVTTYYLTMRKSPNHLQKKTSLLDPRDPRPFYSDFSLQICLLLAPKQHPILPSLLPFPPPSGPCVSAGDSVFVYFLFLFSLSSPVSTHDIKLAFSRGPCSLSIPMGLWSNSELTKGPLPRSDFY